MKVFNHVFGSYRGQKRIVCGLWEFSVVVIGIREVFFFLLILINSLCMLQQHSSGPPFQCRK